MADSIGANAARPRAAVERAPAIRYDLRSGLPDVASFPRKTWQSATARAMRELPDAWLLYGRPRGFSGLRVALTDYLARSRATVAEPSRILVCTGISHGMTMLWCALRERGAQRIGVEDPGWPSQAESVLYAGLEPVPIRVDERGLVVSELDDAEVDAVVVTPSHHYPTGVVMAPERRSELLQWARRRRHSDRRGRLRRRVPLRPRSGRPPLQGLAPDHVVYAGHRQQDARARPAPGMARHSLLAGGRRDRTAAGAQGNTGRGRPGRARAT